MARVRIVRLATRGSPLALRQTELVADLLAAAHPGLEVEPVVVRTRGDQLAEAPLELIGGQGVFVTEVEAAVADGRAHAAVHSAKDLPSTMPDHLTLAAVPLRADARDGLVGCTLAGLPPGGLVATGSARRRAQLAHLRPDLVFTGLRGNMARRVAVGEQEGVAVVVAVAAMDRLGWRDRLTDILDPVDLLPQAGQGAIALQCRADDAATRSLLLAVDHEPSRRAVRAERAVLAGLGGELHAARGGVGGSARRWRRARHGHGGQRRRPPPGPHDGRGRRSRGDGRRAGAGLARRGRGGHRGIRRRHRGGRTVTVYLVGAGPGDPGLLTRRGARLLARADVVLHDRLVSPGILDLVPTSAELIDVGKDPDAAAGETARQEQIIKLLIEHGRRSQVVVRLKGGDPFLFGRGGEETEALTGAGIPWQVVPGVTSAFGVPASVGIPVTQRGLASSVTVVTGRVGDSGLGAPDWTALARAGGTLVILMGMTERAAIAEALVAGGRPADTPVAVIERGTTASQRVERTTLDRLGQVELGSPAVIVVGDVAALGQEVPGGQFGGPLSGRTVVATRSGSRAKNLVDALERAGAEVVELPLTRQVDAADGGAALRAAADAVWSYGWVVLTSVNAVNRFMAQLRDARALSPVRVAGRRARHRRRAAAGRRRARPGAGRAQRAGPGGGVRAGRRVRRLAHLVPVRRPGPRHHPRRAAPKGLARRPGRGLPDGPGVRSRPRGPGPRGAERTPWRSPPARRCTRSWPCADPTANRCPCRATWCASGPTTAAAARAAGLGGVREAWGASAEGMVAELIDHFGGHEGGTP